MAGPDLRARLTQAVQRTNVVPLGVAGEARLRVAQVEATAAPAAAPAIDADDNYGDMLAAIDELVAAKAEGAADVGPVATRPALVAAPPTTAATAAAPPDELRGSAPLSLAQGIKLVNQTHFVAPHAGQSTIWRDSVDHDTAMRTVVPVSTHSFRLEFANVTVDVPTPGGGVKAMQLPDLWVRSKHRREYPRGVVLQPEGKTPEGAYNLWQGFGVTRQAGDAIPMLAHIDMLCGGNRVLVGYVLDWFAFCVQRPGSRPEVALVFRGPQGTGKGITIRMMLKIFARHGLHITQPKHLVGNFNAHLRYALFLFVDEGHWPGDKSAEGVLKGLITEPTIAIEQKGQDVFTVPNRLKMVMASNNAWVVPAGADERRYCVIDVPATRAQDHDYFGKLNAWIDADGAAIFLDHLMSRDLSGFNIRAVPKTAALDRQKIEAMGALDRWMLEALEASTTFTGSEWGDAPHQVSSDSAIGGFDMYCRRTNARGSRADARTIGRRFGEVFGCGPATVARAGTHARVRAWTLPGITEARERAARAFGLTHHQWGQV